MSVLRSWLLAAAVLVGLSASACFGGPVYFVVGENGQAREHTDGFVLPLESPSDIAHARDLIDRGPDVAGAPIVFAEILPGADGVNRNVTAQGQPLWNWHVSKFEGFADIGVELTDGWPTFVEQDVAGWIANTTRDPGNPAAPGHIGFWNYTVIRELSTGGDGSTPPASVPLPTALYAGSLVFAGIVVRQSFAGR